MATRRYEVVFIIEATSKAAGLAAANAAWYAIDDSTTVELVTAYARERLPDRMVDDPRWAGWGEDSDIEIAIRYLD